MTKSIKNKPELKEDALTRALDKLVDKAKLENEALKKILEGMDKIHKKEIEQKLNSKTKHK